MCSPLSALFEVDLGNVSQSEAMESNNLFDISSNFPMLLLRILQLLLLPRVSAG